MPLLRLALLALSAAPSALAATVTTSTAPTHLVTAVPLEQEFVKTSTTPYYVDAIPLEGEDSGESTTTGFATSETTPGDERSLDDDSTSGTDSPSTTGNLGDETPEEDTAGAKTSSAPSEEATAAPEAFLAYAPYRNSMDREPVAVLEPVTGRWVSKDVAGVKLINTVPAFILPQVEVGDHEELTEEDRKGHNKKNKNKRTKNRKGHNKKNKNKRTKRHAGTTSSIVASCGGTFRELYGVIQSPDFPLYYPNNKKCTFDIEVPADHTLKITCDRFMMQGGTNCSHDYMMVDFTGDTMFSMGQKFCGLEAPNLVSNGTRMTIEFQSDDLFRYQGFSCRYRALMPNGNAVIGSFGNTTDENPYPNGNNFLQVVQCPSMGGEVMTNTDDGSTSSNTGTGTSLYSGMWNGQCGSTLPGLPPTNRIVGGYSTEEHQFPWMAAVLKRCGESYCHICGATIVSESWILTGAHCMVNVDKEDLRVLVGDHNLYTISNSQKAIKVKEKVVHPDYNKRGNVTSPLNNDIGLLRLEFPIVFTSQVAPLCLPALGETGFGGSAYGNGSTELDTTGLDIVGKNATVLGWGMVNDAGDFSDALRGVEVEILDNDVCNRLFGIMTETMMCTSGSNGRGTCYGDSGGPAIVKQADGSYVQVGILSFGAQAGCEKGYPSGQVLVHKFIDWIQSVTGIAFGAVFG